MTVLNLVLDLLSCLTGLAALAIHYCPGRPRRHRRGGAEEPE
jgi:hypothetical protein